MTQDQDNNNLDDLQAKIAEQERLNAEQEATAESEMTAQDFESAEIERLTRVAQQATADLANFKRGAEEEKKQFVQFANANLILELLQVVDNFDRALQNIPGEIEGNEWISGIKGIDQQFHAILEKQGLTKIPTVGEKLDVVKHEPLMQGPGEKDIILQEFEAGYMLGERVIRPAKVQIGNGQ